MSLANALKKAASASLKKLGGDVTIRQVTAGHTIPLLELFQNLHLIQPLKVH